MALIPASLLWLRLPDLVALLTFLPLYGVALQLIANLIGVGLFGRCYGTPVPLRVKLAMPFTFLPYQWMIGVSALRAVVRHLLQHGEWEKTEHHGAHRHLEALPAPAMVGAAEGSLGEDA
jgi:hypothetical protein